VFVHVLDWPDRELSLPALGARVVRARMLAGGAAVPVRESADGITLTIAPAPDEPDRVVLLELAHSARGDR
jgi:alpha-L-fucosidase